MCGVLVVFFLMEVQDLKNGNSWCEEPVRQKTVIVHLLLFSRTTRQGIYLEVISDAKNRYQPACLWKVAANGVGFEGEQM